MDTQETALAVRPRAELMPAMGVKEAEERYNAMVAFVQTTMKPGTHYGTIPGTNDKRTLFKAGAELLCSFFGFGVDFARDDGCLEDWDRGRFHYSYRCEVRSVATGKLIAVGYGSCNSMERKYRYRNVPEKYASAEEKAAAVGKKAGKYGTSLVVPNSEPFELVNTIQKMAQKRALVAAVLIAANASAFFTQDLDDSAFVTARDIPAPAGSRGADIDAKLNGEEPEERQPIDAPEADGGIDFADWIAEVHRVAAERGITDEMIDHAIEQQAKRSGVVATAAPAEWYIAFVGWLRDGKLDFLKRKAAPPQPTRNVKTADDSFATEAAAAMDAIQKERENGHKVVVGK